MILCFVGCTRPQVKNPPRLISESLYGFHICWSNMGCSSVPLESLSDLTTWTFARILAFCIHFPFHMVLHEVGVNLLRDKAFCILGKGLRNESWGGWFSLLMGMPVWVACYGPDTRCSPLCISAVRCTWFIYFCNIFFTIAGNRSLAAEVTIQL